MNGKYRFTKYQVPRGSNPILQKDLVTKDLGKWMLHAGACINDDEQIFGEMMNPDTYESRCYRLDPVPVPEPSTIIVFTAGSLLYLVRNKMRKKF